MSRKNCISLFMLIVCGGINPLILSQTFWITSNADSGPGTVRQAITDLNNSVDAVNEIKVALAGNTTVALESELPSLNKPVTFDGQDQLSPSPLILTANVPLTHVIVVEATASGSTIKNITINEVYLTLLAALVIRGDMCTVDQCALENIHGAPPGTYVSLGSVIGIHIMSGSMVSVSNCTVDTLSNESELTTMYGIALTNASNFATISNCAIRNLQGSGIGTGLPTGSMVAGIYSDSSVTDLTIMNIAIETVRNDVENGQAYGILHEEGSGTGSSNSAITDCTISTISSGVKTNGSIDDSCAVGIRSQDTIKSVLRNTITSVSSPDSMGNPDAGRAHGIVLRTNFECTSNTISNISSGSATTESTAHGIVISNPTDCSFNTISNIFSGDALISQAFGIILFTLIDAGCDGNTISTITGQQNAIGINILLAQRLEMGSTLSGNSISAIQSDAVSIGIFVVTAHEMPLVINIIQDIQASSGAAYGIALGDDDGSVPSVTDTVIAENLIQHIHGTLEGIGIILFGDVLQNKLLSNLICDVTTKGIAILDSPVDATCVLLRSFLLPNGDIQVRGLLSQVAFINEPYILQFFANPCNTVPEAPRLIQELLFTPTSSPASFDLTFTPTSTVEKNQYLTMTATAFSNMQPPFQNNNTSELSNIRRVRTDTNTLCTFVCDNGADGSHHCTINR